MELRSKDKKIKEVKPVFFNTDKTDCLVFNERNHVRKIAWTIPADFSTKNQKLHFKVEFCNPTYANQPKEIDSREFEVR